MEKIKKQIEAWIGKRSISAWDKSFEGKYAFVAIIEDKLVAFGDICKNGYIDRLFVHKDFQNMKIGSIMLEKLEKSDDFKNYTVRASITAKPFFEKYGYVVNEEILAEINGEKLLAYNMEKNVL